MLKKKNGLFTCASFCQDVWTSAKEPICFFNQKSAGFTGFDETNLTTPFNPEAIQDYALQAHENEYETQFAPHFLHNL